MNSVKNVTSGYVTVYLKGGLGNQLFQTAYGVYMSNLMNKKFVFVKQSIQNKSLHNHSKTSYVLDDKILSNFEFITERLDFGLYKEPTETLHPSEFKICHFNVAFDGYFQHYKYISDEFIFNLNLKGVCLPKNYAFLHIRGGDYLNVINKNLFCIDVNKLQKQQEDSIKEFPNGTHFQIFTNDMHYSKNAINIEEIFAKVNSNDKKYSFQFVDQTNEEDSFNQMIHSTLGGIITNSTFSWWAATISNTMSDGQRIFTIPSIWFNDISYYTEGFYAPFFKVISL